MFYTQIQLNNDKTAFRFLSTELVGFDGAAEFYITAKRPTILESAAMTAANLLRESHIAAEVTEGVVINEYTSKITFRPSTLSGQDIQHYLKPVMAKRIGAKWLPNAQVTRNASGQLVITDEVKYLNDPHAINWALKRLKLIRIGEYISLADLYTRYKNRQSRMLNVVYTG
jgi:hypothetical protein